MGEGLFHIVHKKLSSKSNQILTIIVGLMLVLFATLKPLGFDNDSNGYYYLIHNEEAAVRQLEFTFLFFVDLFKFLGVGAYVHKFVFATYSSLTILFIYIVIYNETNKRPLIPFLIFMMFFYPLLVLTQIRFGLAVAIMLFALQKVRNSRYSTALLLLISAALIHVSMFFLTPILLVSNTRRVYYFSIPVLVTMLYFLYYYNNIFNDIIPDFILSKIHIYSNEDLRDIGTLNSLSIFVFGSVIYLLCTRLKDNFCYIRILLLFAFAYLFFFQFATISDRFLVSAAAVSILTMAGTLAVPRSRFESMVSFCCILFAMIYCVRDVYFNELLHIVG